MPIFKSCVDPLILFYINYFYQIELGFSFGNYEDSPDVPIIQKIARRIGHLLIRRKDNSSDMSTNYVNQALLEEVIYKNVVTTIF